MFISLCRTHPFLSDERDRREGLRLYTLNVCLISPRLRILNVSIRHLWCLVVSFAIVIKRDWSSY